MDVRSIIESYYSEITRGFKTGNLDVAKLHLAETVSIIGPDERFEGKEIVEKMFTGFVGLVSTCEIKHQYFGTDSACTIINFVSKDGSHTVLTAEIITVKNSEIVKMEVIFDTAQWAKFIPTGF